MTGGVIASAIAAVVLGLIQWFFSGTTKDKAISIKGPGGGLDEA